MTSHTTKSFRRLLERLPPHVQQHAEDTFRLWLEAPHHPSLHFKQVHTTKPVYSARVGIHYRVLGLKKDDSMYIGTGLVHTMRKTNYSSACNESIG